MRLITEKSKNEIGKKLSAIYYITIHGFGNGCVSDLESSGKIVEHIHDIAYAVGGERFAHIEIPSYVYELENRIGEEHEQNNLGNRYE